MGHFLFVLVLLASSTALDAASAKGGVVHLLRTRLRLLNCRPQVNFWLAAVMAVTAIV